MKTIKLADLRILISRSNWRSNEKCTCIDSLIQQHL